MNEPNKTITIDGQQYDLNALSDNAKSQVVNLRVVDEEIRKTEAQLAIYKTARVAYARALKGELSKPDQPN